MEQQIPQELARLLGSEPKDFIVKAGRVEPLKHSIQRILFGLTWTAISGFVLFVFLRPLFFGQEVRFETNGVPSVASVSNLEPLMWPILFLGIFVLFGIGLLVWSIRSLTQEGGYFVGTQERLVQFHNGIMKSIDWEQFSGYIEVSGTPEKGTILLQMRTGKMIQRNKREYYVPDTLYMSDISTLFKIEEICRKRIKENDPTPSTSSTVL